jgi:hypothetical protein
MHVRSNDWYNFDCKYAQGSDNFKNEIDSHTRRFEKKLNNISRILANFSWFNRNWAVLRIIS